MKADTRTFYSRKCRNVGEKNKQSRVEQLVTGTLWGVGLQNRERACLSLVIGALKCVFLKENSVLK